MTEVIGRNRNTNDEAKLSDAISLNATTSTKIADALERRISFTISNPSANGVWIKFQAASVDDDKKGTWLPKRSIYEMPTDNIYIGEISAISDAGTPDIYITEF